jgi:hypothetical protein
MSTPRHEKNSLLEEFLTKKLTKRPKDFDYKTHYIDLFRVVENYVKTKSMEDLVALENEFQTQLKDIDKQIVEYGAVKSQDSTLISINNLEFKTPYRLVDLLKTLYEHKLLKIVPIKSIPPINEAIHDDSLEREWLKIISTHLVMAGIAQTHPQKIEFLKYLKINKWTLGVLFDDLIEAWHGLNDSLLQDVELHDFLGLTWEEYKQFTMQQDNFFEAFISEIKGNNAESSQF